MEYATVHDNGSCWKIEHRGVSTWLWVLLEWQWINEPQRYSGAQTLAGSEDLALSTNPIIVPDCHGLDNSPGALGLET